MGAAETGVAGYIAAWCPVSVPPQAACFARAVVGQAAPAGRAGAGEEPAVGRGKARQLGDRPRPGGWRRHALHQGGIGP